MTKASVLTKAKTKMNANSPAESVTAIPNKGKRIKQATNRKSPMKNIASRAKLTFTAGLATTFPYITIRIAIGGFPSQTGKLVPEFLV